MNGEKTLPTTRPPCVSLIPHDDDIWERQTVPLLAGASKYLPNYQGTEDREFKKFHIHPHLTVVAIVNANVHPNIDLERRLRNINYSSNQ